jgi:hypothetical protein
MFKITSLVLGLFCALQTGCGTGQWVVEFGGNEHARQGMTESDFDDGCSASFSLLPVIIHGAILSDSSNFAIASTDIAPSVFNATFEEDLLLWESEVTAFQYPAHRIHIAPAVLPGHQEGITAEEAIGFSTNNGAIGFYGELTCPNGTVQFQWLFSPDEELRCLENVKVPKDGRGVVRFQMDPSQIFRQSVYDQGSDLILGQPIVAADANNDGYITISELESISLDSLEGYEDNEGDLINNLFKHIDALSERALWVNDTRCTRFD